MKKLCAVAFTAAASLVGPQSSWAVAPPISHTEAVATQAQRGPLDLKTDPSIAPDGNDWLQSLLDCAVLTYEVDGKTHFIMPDGTELIYDGFSLFTQPSGDIIS